jgi:hypothetical protein
MYVLFSFGTGYVGEEAHEVYEFDDNTSEDSISDYGYELACQHAESYGHYEGEDEDGVEFEPEMDWQILDETRDEIEDLYGEITKA